jgi:hypothetical protein
MIVVTESPVGTRATYWFELRNGEHVWIGGDKGDENIVYIPARCVKARFGDYSSCGQLLKKKT